MRVLPSVRVVVRLRPPITGKRHIMPAPPEKSNPPDPPGRRVAASGVGFGSSGLRDGAGLATIGRMAKQDRPNVVLFVTHDTGQHVTPYGIEQVQTPHCERLAGEGVTFRHSFCTTPLCAPSRAAIVTGQYPHTNGVMGLTGQATGLFDFHHPEHHAAAIFRDAGYRTLLCGFEHETPHWHEAGFEEAIAGSGGWFNGGGDLLTFGDELDGWLGSRAGDKPFYCQIGCHETHHAWDKHDTPPDESRGVWMPPYLKDIPEVRAEMAQFQGAVKRLDEGLGRIMDAFDRHGLRENTIFVFTTDHGIDMPRAKGTFYDPGIETFLFMRYPAGGWEAGSVREELTTNVDILPTLLEACGIDVPPRCQGRSFLPLLAGGAYEPRDMVFSEKTFHDTYDPTRCIRTDRYKYIRYFEVNIFQDLRLATITRRDYFKDDWRRKTIEELYDLENDPDEMHNVVDDEAHAETLERMRRELITWMRQTEDPLLEGPVSSPRYRQELEALKQLG